VARDITDQGWFFSGDSPPDGSEFPVYEPGICRPPDPYGCTLLTADRVTGPRRWTHGQHVIPAGCRRSCLIAAGDGVKEEVGSGVAAMMVRMPSWRRYPQVSTEVKLVHDAEAGSGAHSPGLSPLVADVLVSPPDIQRS